MTSQPEVSKCYTLLVKIIRHVEQKGKEREGELVDDEHVRKCASKAQRPEDCWH